MKKIVLIALIGIITQAGIAQTAVNFSCKDCSNNSHDLFNELKAGKVVVITWVMPCGQCIGVASTVASTVSGLSNPNVVFYLVDDYANTTCSTLNGWASTNSITTNANFSNAAIKMSDYGTDAMQKTVV